MSGFIDGLLFISGENSVSGGNDTTKAFSICVLVDILVPVRSLKSLKEYMRHLNPPGTSSSLARLMNTLLISPSPYAPLVIYMLTSIVTSSLVAYLRHPVGKASQRNPIGFRCTEGWLGEVSSVSARNSLEKTQNIAWYTINLCGSTEYKLSLPYIRVSEEYQHRRTLRVEYLPVIPSS